MRQAWIMTIERKGKCISKTFYDEDKMCDYKDSISLTNARLMSDNEELFIINVREVQE